jgi:formylglycine-generating enzyme required for sulfatase activity
MTRFLLLLASLVASVASVTCLGELSVPTIDPAVVGTWRSVLPNGLYITLWIGAGGDYRNSLEGTDARDAGEVGVMQFAAGKFSQTDHAGKTVNGAYSLSNGTLSIQVDGHTLTWFRSSHALTDALPVGVLMYRMGKAGEKKIDPGTTGTWTCLENTDAGPVIVTHTIDDQGGYKASYQGSGKRPTETGTQHFVHESWDIRLDSGQASHGTYVLRDADTLAVTGQRGAQTWLRYYPAPEPPTGVAKLPEQAVAKLKSLPHNVGQSWTNSVGMTLTYIPAGTFVRGKYKVAISKDLLMGIAPVTQSQWKHLVGENPSPIQGNDLPIESVSYQEAVSYCKALSEVEGMHYRLPTEAEWEYACRAGTDTAYCNGNDVAALEKVAWYAENSGGKPHPVCQKLPNAWGMYDLNGDIYQWCADNWEPVAAFDVTDPLLDNGSLDHVIRGGSYRSDAERCKTAQRDHFTAAESSTEFGFRICLDLAQPAKSLPVQKIAVKPSVPFPPTKVGESWSDSLGISFCYVPAGNFNIKPSFGPLFKVTLSKSYLMAATPVTQAQWKAVMGSNPSTRQGDDLPVETISYDDAVAFCDKLSQKEGKFYRLPTACEFEYACRAGTTTNFYTGDDAQAMNEAGWFAGNSSDMTHPVGLKKPNAWGLYDMHGNVQEWTKSWAGIELVQSKSVDPQGPPTGTQKVVKGGAYNLYPIWCAAYQANLIPPYQKFPSCPAQVARQTSRASHSASVHT